MSAFRVGQRVRIVFPGNWNHGKEATIWKIAPNSVLARRKGFNPEIHHNVCVYCTDVVGVGEYNNGGQEIAYLAQDLVPLTDPGAAEFIARMFKPAPRLEKELN